MPDCLLLNQVMAEKEKYQRIELIALLFTGMLKFILMDHFDMRAFYVAGMCIFWLSYILYRYYSDKSILKYWGFRRDNFRKSCIVLSPLIFFIILFSTIYGHYSGKLILTWHIIPILVLYPVWGALQQFFMLGLIARNLNRIFRTRFNNYLVVFITALLFSLIHYPVLSLMIFTILMEILFILVYHKWNNLWALGLVHGWTASFLLFFVSGRDLWLELFSWFNR
jgi:hypothetical protein